MKRKNLIFIFAIFVIVAISVKGQSRNIYVDNLIKLYPDTIAYPTEAKSYKWNYEQGLVLEGVYQAYKQTGLEEYYEYLKKNIDYYVTPKGEIKTYDFDSFNIDNISSGRILLHLYEKTGEEKYKIAADRLLEQLKAQPRTSEGGYWHKKIYPNQMWLDGLFMAEPFYSEYSKMFNKVENYKDIYTQYRLIHKNLYDEKTGLYYHGWDETRKMKWADSVTGRSPNFWGRSIGWLIMSMTEVLQSYPKDCKEYDEILNMYKNLAESLLKYQDPKTKLWFQIIDKGNKKGNYIETSASLMFIYSFIKGYNTKLLDKKYYEIAKESYELLKREFIKKDENGNLFLQNVVSVGGLGGNPFRDGSFEYYISEPIRENDFKGYGVLILVENEFNKSFICK
jgi:unsaturated rhamnogalacturonyl hydrolase